VKKGSDAAKVVGWLDNLRGTQNEKRALRICQQIARSNRPQWEWILAARKATLVEDAQGKDIVVNTTAGRFFLQCKSSPKHVAEFKRRIARSKRDGRDDMRRIGVVLVAGTDEQIRDRILREIRKLRAS